MSIIDHTFVINLKNRTDRWQDIQKRFENTNLKLERWDAVNGRDLSEEYINSITSGLCNYFCSPAMIGCWLSHYTLWKYIVDNKLNNVLVLEDDAIPVTNFNNKLIQYWKNIPSDWDIIFLGCSGSCDNFPNSDTTIKYIYGENKKINGNDHLIVPSFPLMTHAYMISYNGAKKLISEELLKKVKYHIDYYMSKFIYNKEDKNIKMYAFTPYLIYQDVDSPSDNTNDAHYLITKMSEGLNASEQVTMPTLFSTNCCFIRPLGIPISILTLLIIFIWTLFTVLPFNPYTKGVLIAILIYESYELFISKNKTKTRTIGLELFIMLLIFLIIWFLRFNHNI